MFKKYFFTGVLMLLLTAPGCDAEEPEDQIIRDEETPEEVKPRDELPDTLKTVGLAYTTWHRPALWNNYWGTPELGKYVSDDRSVIRQHGEWLADADVDFIFIDWSNDIDYVYGKTRDRADFDMIEETVPVIFEEWESIENAPKIAIMLGCPGKKEAFTDGRMQRKIDQVYDMFIDNEERRDQYYDYLGKPLIMVYVGTPSPFQTGLPEGITDNRFIYRYVTGYVSEQAYLRTPEGLSKYGYWSWEERGEQTYTMLDGKPECCTISAASRPQRGDDPDHPHHIPARGRENGDTFKERWKRARDLDVKVALVVSWNEWVKGEQPSPEFSKDLEPSEEFGDYYLQLLKQEIKNFKK